MSVGRKKAHGATGRRSITDASWGRVAEHSQKGHDASRESSSRLEDIRLVVSTAGASDLRAIRSTIVTTITTGDTLMSRQSRRGQRDTFTPIATWREDSIKAQAKDAADVAFQGVQSNGKDTKR